MISSPIKYIDLAAECAKHHLEIVGVVAAQPNDPVPIDTQAIALLGPDEPGFWPHLQKEPEFLDGQPDPLDRWSERTIENLALSLSGSAVFPFGGPLDMPFVSWALRSMRAWSSPVGLLVHDTAGLFLSFRGALCLPYSVDPGPRPNKPCQTCASQPCRSACPVNALTGAVFALDACHTYLDSTAGQDCLDNGCAARRACPVSRRYGRLTRQSAHHMTYFHT